MPNIKSEVCNVQKSFFIIKKIREKKAPNTFLMLNFKFKSLHLISSFVGHKESVTIIKEYNRRSLYPLLLKPYNHSSNCKI
jgi:hypothetical protein